MSVPGSVVLSEVTSGALFVAVLQELKKWFPALQDMPPWVLRTMSIIWALISIIIIGYEWTPNANGGGVLTITIPSFMAAIMGLWKWGEQFAINEVIYRTAVKPGASPAGQSPLPPSKYSIPEARK